MDRTNESNNLYFAELRTALVLFWERFWPLVLPFVGVISLFLILSWFGVWPLLPNFLRIGLLVIFGVLVVLSLRPLRLLELPDRESITRRLEVASGLSHRPITARQDKRVNLSGQTGEFSGLLWDEHLRRSRRDIDNLTSGLPDPRISRYDPFALRSLVVLGLVISFVSGRDDLTGHILDAFRYHSLSSSVIATRIDAWIKPPLYTNKPPVFLSGNDGDNVELSTASVRIPEGSELVVRVFGLDSVSVDIEDSFGISARLEPGSSDESALSDESVLSFSEILESDGVARLVTSDDTVLRDWSWTVIEDESPSVSFVRAPSTTDRGLLELAYEMTDDYGVVEGRAKISSTESLSPSSRPSPRPLVSAPEVFLSLPSDSSSGSSRVSRDISSHPWAGSRALIHLEVEDAAGQIGRSSSLEITLPSRIFTDPLARAVVYERRRLALDSNLRRDVSNMLDTITSTRPETFIPDYSHYFALRVAYHRIRGARDDDVLRESLGLLWDIALAIEDGDLSLMERLLRDARERLERALERGASDDELERLMSELREAMRNFMEELYKHALKNPEEGVRPDGRSVDSSDIDEMMQQIEDLARSGSRDAARDLLDQFQRMMDNLEFSRPSPGRDPFSEQMDELGDLIQRQQELMDETHDLQRRYDESRRGQQQGQQQQRGQQGQQQGQRGQQGQGQGGDNSPLTPEEFAEAMRRLQDRQGSLRERMDSLRQAMRDLGLDPGRSMDNASRSMGSARDNLGRNRTGRATQNQGEALSSMREGAERLLRNMEEQARERGRRGERGQHGEQSWGDQDPLGRYTGDDGSDWDGNTDIPGAIDTQRAREVLDLIRRRLGESHRPRPELDYLDRLLPVR